MFETICKLTELTQREVLEKLIQRAYTGIDIIKHEEGYMKPLGDRILINMFDSIILNKIKENLRDTD